MDYKKYIWLALLIILPLTIRANIVNNSGSTAADSLSLPFYALDSVGNMTTLTTNDSLYLVVWGPGGAEVFRDTVAFNNALIDTVHFSGDIMYVWKIAVADVDGGGADGVHSYHLMVHDNTSAALTTPHKGTFLIYQTADYNTWADRLTDSLQGVIDSLQNTLGNVVAISGDGGAADNLETMLDGTGGGTFDLAQLAIRAGSAEDTGLVVTGADNGPGAVFMGSGTGSGALFTGEPVAGNASGMAIAGGNTGSGLEIDGFSNPGVDIASDGAAHALAIEATGTGDGVNIIGGDEGIEIVAGTTGDGINIAGGATSGAAIRAWADGTNDTGAVFAGIGTGISLSAPSIDFNIEAANIAANAIGASELATDAIGAAEIAADAITASEVAANAIGASELATDAIGTAELAASAIMAIVDSILNIKLTDTVGAATFWRQILEGTDTSDFADVIDVWRNIDTAGSIDTSDIGDWFVNNIAGSGGLDSGVVSNILHRIVWGTAVGSGSDSSTLAQRDVTIAAIVNDIITAAAIATDAIGAAEIAAGAITASEMAAVDTIYAIIDSLQNTLGNVVQISGDAAAADAWETMLDGTGGNTFSLAQLRIITTAAEDTGVVIRATDNGFAIFAQGSGSGAAAGLFGGATGQGALIQGGGTSGSGALVRANPGGSNSDGLTLTATGNGKALSAAEIDNITDTVQGIIDTLQNQDDWVAQESTVDALHDTLIYQGPNGFGVWIDESAANANTTLGTDGTEKNPVSTFAAARTVADALGARRYYITGRSTFIGPGDSLTVTHEEWEFIGVGSGNSMTLDASTPVDVDASCFINLTMSGGQGGTEDVSYFDCIIDDLINIDGFFHNCGLRGDFSIAATDDLTAEECFSMIPGNGTPSISLTAGASNFGLRAYSGGIEIQNVDTNDSVSIETDGQVIINANCTNARITLRGNMTITDNGTNTTLTRDAALNAEYIVDQNWDELASGHTTALTYGDTLLVELQRLRDSVDAIIDSLQNTLGNVVSVNAGAIEAGDIEAGGIGATELAANAIGAAEIAADAIGPTEIATDAIDADALATDAIDEIWEFDTANFDQAAGVGMAIKIIQDSTFAISTWLTAKLDSVLWLQGNRTAMAIHKTAANVDTLFLLQGSTAAADTIGYEVYFHTGGSAGGAPDSTKSYIGTAGI